MGCCRSKIRAGAGAAKDQCTAGRTKAALTKVVELKHANQAGIDVQAKEGWEARVVHGLLEELQGLPSDLFQLCSKVQGSSSACCPLPWVLP